MHITIPLPRPGMCLCVQDEYLLLEMLGTECVLNFFFQILEYLHIHNEISWVWEPSLSTNSCLFHAHLRNIADSNFIQYFFLVCLCFDCDLSHEVWHGETFAGAK